MEKEQQVPPVQEAPEPSRSPSSSSSSSPQGQNSPKPQDGSKSPMQPLADHHEDDKQDRQNNDRQIVRYNQCCRVCKHTDKSKKACVCVVPLSQRRSELGETGCRNCGCKGCSREDYTRKGEDPVYYPPSENKKTVPLNPKKEDRRSPGRRPNRNKSPSSDGSPEIIDSYTMRFNNFDKSVLGHMIVNEFQLNPALMGFAIPQRSYSYIFGKPR